MANEKRMISYDVLIKHLDSCIKEGKGLFRATLVAVKCFVVQMPTVDAVEVIRCEHCACNDMTDNDKRRGIVWYKKICRYMKADGFCSEGERRTQ